MISYLIAGIFIAYRLLSGLWGPMIASTGVFLGYLALRQVYCQGNTVEGFSLPFTWLGLLAFVSLLKKPDQTLSGPFGSLPGCQLFLPGEQYGYSISGNSSLAPASLEAQWLYSRSAERHFCLLRFFPCLLCRCSHSSCRGSESLMGSDNHLQLCLFCARASFYSEGFFASYSGRIQAVYAHLYLCFRGLAFSVYDLFKKKSQESALAALLCVGIYRRNRI